MSNWKGPAPIPFPQVFEQIHLKFVVTGKSLAEKQVARAVDLSMEKYCSVSLMLEKSGRNYP